MFPGYRFFGRRLKMSARSCIFAIIEQPFQVTEQYLKSRLIDKCFLADYLQKM